VLVFRRRFVPVSRSVTSGVIGQMPPIPKSKTRGTRKTKNARGFQPPSLRLPFPHVISEFYRKLYLTSGVGLVDSPAWPVTNE
jgi:hypothetical protein